VTHANEAGKAIGSITSGSQQVNAAVNDITHALHEQSAVSVSIAQQVELIARMTEENSSAILKTCYRNK